jgi:F-type H+-transporting ATPase subunit a
MSEPKTAWRRVRTWFDTPAGRITLLALGLALMFGSPLLAEEPTDSHADDTHATDSHAVDDHSGDAAHGDGHGDEAHGDGHGDGHGGGALHFPTAVRIIANAIAGYEYHDAASAVHDYEEGKLGVVPMIMWKYEDTIYSGIIILVLGIFFWRVTRNLKLVPGPWQNFAEAIVGGLDDFIQGVLGPEGRKHVPFLGTLGLYIYIMNVSGLFPLMKAPTSILETTAAMAVCVFLYVQFTAVKMNGIGGYLFHLAGEPRDAVGWAMSPLMLPLHIIGELAKPLSLALRLFGNIMGEDLLLVVFAGLGVSLLAFTHLPIGFPLHLPFMFLGLLTTLIQAVVFMLLSTIYIALVMPHEEGH